VRRAGENVAEPGSVVPFGHVQLLLREAAGFQQAVALQIGFREVGAIAA
jgi:hypothetical protein